MKKFFTISLLLIAGYAASFSQQIHWKQCNGPNGGYINCLTQNGDNLYAGTDGMGIYRASAQGENWTLISPANTTSWTLEFRSDTIYAGTLVSGIIRSTDAGSTWTEINNGIPRKVIDKDTMLPAIRALLYQKSTLFAGAFNFGLLGSSDGGANWSQIKSLQAENVMTLTSFDDNIWAGTNKGVFYSTDNGETWAPRNEGLPEDAIYGIVRSGSSYYVATYQSGVFKSDDEGKSWKPMNEGLPILQIWTIGVKGETIYAGTHGSGAFSVAAGDTTWKYIQQIGRADVRSILPSQSNLFVGTYSGVWESSDDGVKWEAVGLPRNVISSLAVSSNNIFAGIFAGGAAKSGDGGETWQSANNGVMRQSSTVQCLYANDGSVFAGIYGSDGVYRTDNNGDNWQAANNGLPPSTVWSLASLGNNILAGATDGIYQSTDQGDSWEIVSDATQYFRTLSLAVQGQSIYAGTMEGVYRSYDGGVTWTGSGVGIENKNIGALATLGSALFAGAIDSNGGIYRSTDAGKSWHAVGNFSKLYGTCFAVKGSALFAGTNKGIFLTTDNGDSWENASDGIIFTEINSIAIQGSKLYAGTIGGSVYTADAGLLDVKQNETIAPPLFNVVSSDEGVVAYFAEPQPKSGVLTLTNIVGNKIITVEFPAGSESVAAGKILAGLYFCTVKTPDCQYVARVITIR